MGQMKGGPFSSVHIYSSSLAAICFCRYVSPNCLRFEQSLRKEQK